ncbi:Hsp70 family protein [Novosphingobium sediminicola]|uniref:Molecular chaperone HscC n=1 Tax=Novosphingobium sediminicola TaxID=563162 RepID=A0A7W6G8D2_9SPHN|nr:Hsp70 family protein [Novosphingobium sediminicola]MBB3957100.1 molecular chaperone HscC [Novosphingobium sediminicola]
MLIGIDLGTTNSAVAIWRNGASELVPNARGDFLTPSAVHIGKDGIVSVGTAALDRMADDPLNTATSFKRHMGVQRHQVLGGKAYTAEELSALVLRSLREDVIAYTGETPTEAVITVPAYFNDRQRKATRRAGELAGLTARRLINEPTAAALAFGLQDKADREPFLVFDLGGGTFDVSIVEMFEGIVEVRASAGDNRLGGDDFNIALAAMARRTADPEGALDNLPQARREAVLLRAAEKARRQLSHGPEASFSFTLGDRSFAATVSEAEFEKAAEDLLRRLRDPVVRSLRDCGIDPKDLSEIVLVGGATRMPVVRRAITRMFGRFPNSTVHPDHAVALGAAAQAGLLARDAALDEIRITDVCPFTLGIDVVERDTHGVLVQGLFSPIIERNTAVPASRAAHYHTMSDNQKKIEMGIYQGEARLVADNIQLGKLSVSVPPRPAGEIGIEVRFSYDSSGLLEVDVCVPETGLTRNLVIVDEEDRRDAGEMARRREALAMLKFHPREDAENVALMARAGRIYEDHIGELRQMVGQWMTSFAAALESQDPRRIVDSRALLTVRLDKIEGQSLL